MTDKNQELLNDLNRQTSRIGWSELQRFFAAGNAVYVAPGLDLIEVASEIAQDNKTLLETLMNEGKVGSVSDEQAGEWFETDKLVWAVVVAPWVFVQPCTDTPQ